MLVVILLSAKMLSVVTLTFIMLSAIILSVIMLWRYAEWCCAWCHNAERYYAECHWLYSETVKKTAILLFAVMLSVVAPLKWAHFDEIY